MKLKTSQIQYFSFEVRLDHIAQAILITKKARVIKDNLPYYEVKTIRVKLNKLGYFVHPDDVIYFLVAHVLGIQELEVELYD